MPRAQVFFSDFKSSIFAVPVLLVARMFVLVQIKAAEGVLKEYTKDPACVAPLLQQMRSSQHEQARQLAAVLLKKKIMTHWKTFNDNHKVTTSVAASIHRTVGHRVRHGGGTWL